MTEIMKGEAMPATLPQAIEIYRDLRNSYNAFSEDDDAFERMETAFDQITAGAFPLRDHTDALALLELLRDEAGARVDPYVLKICDMLEVFLATRQPLEVAA